MLYLVCGVSSVGKSSYICSEYANKHIKNIKTKDVHFAYQVAKDDSIVEKDDIVLHYNILNKCKQDKRNKIEYDYTFDELPEILISKNIEFQVILLVASHKLIVQRAKHRKYLEENFNLEESLNRYNADEWLGIYAEIDMQKLYANFYKLIKKFDKKTNIVDTSSRNYKELSSLDEIRRVIKRKSMIISLHIRKAAGSSFRTELLSYYKDKLLLDYGDRVTCSKLSSKYKRFKTKLYLLKNKKQIVEKHSIIHGHFYASKYDKLDANLEYVTFLRDPIQRVLSNYYYLKRQAPRQHSDSIVIHKHNYTLHEYIEHKDARNSQSAFLAGKKLSEFKFIGIVEEYDKSIELFNKLFSTKLNHQTKQNANPNIASQYNIDETTLNLIIKYNKEDIKLYEEAKSIFYNKLKEENIIY